MLMLVIFSYSFNTNISSQSPCMACFPPKAVSVIGVFTIGKPAALKFSGISVFAVVLVAVVLAVLLGAEPVPFVESAPFWLHPSTETEITTIISINVSILAKFLIATSSFQILIHFLQTAVSIAGPNILQRYFAVYRQ
jgi:hypothetical protein